MKDLQIFESEEFGNIRTLEEDGKVLFCGKDVARALGYDQPLKAIDRHCKSGGVRFVPHPQSENKTVEMKFIPEGDVYRLIVSSRLPTAEKFERWVFDEVLPQLRATGTYTVDKDVEKLMANIALLEQYKNKLNDAKKQYQTYSMYTSLARKDYMAFKEKRDRINQFVNTYSDIVNIYIEMISDEQICIDLREKQKINERNG